MQRCQRKVAKCIKWSRHMGMIPFVGPYRVDVSEMDYYCVFAQFNSEILLGFSSTQFAGALYPTVLRAYT